jgi:hypothetical protein
MIAAVALLFVALVLFIQARHGQEHAVDGGRLMTALAEYAREVRSRGEPLPASITMETLVRSGHLRPEDAKPFDGAELTFYADADETRPQSVLAVARMPDGTVLAVMADGSVQGFARSRWEEYSKSLGQPNGAANRSQPIRSETNQSSPAAGSGR